METVSSPNQPQHARRKPLRSLVWILLCIVFVTSLVAYFYIPSADPRCITLLAHPDGDVAVPMPANCFLTNDAPADQAVKYFENERKQRGLIFKAWILCKPSGKPQTTQFALTNDPHWLPSYVPGAYQYRQTVILLRFVPTTIQESTVAGEVCLMPKRRYASQIAGQCDGKFSVWK